MTEFKKIYKKQLPTLWRARRQLRKILSRVIREIEDKALVRAELRNVRIKKFPSLQQKANKNGWTSEEALSSCSDLVGGRVVCNNTEDVYRFAELLRRASHLASDFSPRDYIVEPSEEGYRALHVNLRLDVREHTSSPSFDALLPNFVPCEVQIRSRLQDSWAELSHDDVYKKPGLPEDLKGRATDLSEVLAAADKIASAIRERAMREIIAPEKRPSLRHVSPDGLAFVFREVFGRSPSDYVVRVARNMCDQLNINTLEKFHKILNRLEFRNKVSEAYRTILDVNIAAESIFLAALHAASGNDDKAIKWIERNAREEKREIEEMGKREALSSLPDTFEKLVEELEDVSDETNAKEYADALDATQSCSICGRTTIDPCQFASAALEHYGMPEEDADKPLEQIINALRGSVAETSYGSLCESCKATDEKDN